ncbi:hypothetical protein Egran_07095 [Elaphomyces granulatus]|uniref:Amidase domain-containing protein n=1 Tax=Elaphomyces granulatus TaxID=519963 RepID=A0A232LMV4_9EURO|nr:hypothetical protein Egran_07095 [Elaphomyces granulatus]
MTIGTRRVSLRGLARIASYFASPPLSGRLASRPLRVGVPIDDGAGAVGLLRTCTSAAPAEVSSNLTKYDGVRYGTWAEGNDGGDGYLYAKTRGQGFGAEVKRRILLGAFSLSADAMDNYFIQAQKVRRLAQADFDAVFDAYNPLLLSPWQMPYKILATKKVGKRHLLPSMFLSPQ